MTTITTRTGKGSALTHQELDDNFSNLNSGKLETSGNISQTGNVAVTGQVSAATISATGNITGNYILGNGSQLTGITGGVTSAAGNNLNFQYNNSGAFAGVPNTAFYTGNGVIEIASAKFEAGAGPSSQITVPGTAGYVSVVGNVIAGNVNAGVITATGNIAGNYILGNGSQLTGVTGSATPGGSANSIQFNNGGALGGITDAFHYTANGITEISKVKFSSTAAGGGSGELFVPGTAGYVSVVGNVIAGNVTTVGQVSATGNITGDYFIGNGSQLTGLPATYSNANVSTFMAAFGSNTISTTGNITSGNIFTAGVVSATGNITGSYILGNGSQLTGITSTASDILNPFLLMGA